MMLQHRMIVPAIQKLRNKLAVDSGAYLMPAEVMPILNAFEQFMVDTASLRAVEIYSRAHETINAREGNTPEFITGFIHGMIAARSDIALLSHVDKPLIERARALLAKAIDEVADKQYELFVSTESAVDSKVAR